MKRLCPTCKGKGTINDPKINGLSYLIRTQGAMIYSDQNGNRCPQVICQTCSGSGWIDENSKFKCEIEALICEREAYIAENLQRATLDQSMAYGPEHFWELAERFRALIEEKGRSNV